MARRRELIELYICSAAAEQGAISTGPRGRHYGTKTWCGCRRGNTLPRAETAVPVLDYGRPPVPAGLDDLPPVARDVLILDAETTGLSSDSDRTSEQARLLWR